jgi:hypothetical protein
LLKWTGEKGNKKPYKTNPKPVIGFGLLIASSLSYLPVYLHFEPKRIGNIVVAVGSTSGSNHDRAIPEDTPDNTLHYLNAFTLCQNKFYRPAADNACLDNYTFVGNGVD